MAKKEIVFRTGDIVKERGNVGIVGSTKGWWLNGENIDVHFMDHGTNEGSSIGVGSLCDKKDLILVQRRENVKNYWKYIANNK